MASINQLFTTMISEGVKAIDGISNPKEKAMAYAEFAKAIATTGLVSLEAGEPSVPSKEDLEEKPKSVKKAAKKPPVKEEPVVEEPVEEVAADEETVHTEWTDEAIEELETEYNTLVEMCDEYEEESLNQVVHNFSNGVLSTIHDITPLNVTAFLGYVDMILNESEA